MNGRILQVNTRQLAALRLNLEIQGVPHDELAAADVVLDKLYREGEPDDTPVEVVLNNEEYAFIRGRWEGNKNFIMLRDQRKLILSISEAIRAAPGFTVKLTDSGPTVERHSGDDTPPTDDSGATKPL
jgi:hypothetical protein